VTDTGLLSLSPYRARCVAAVFSASLWYSKLESAGFTQSVPTSPGGSSFPSSSRIANTVPGNGRPTLPGCSSHSCGEMTVPPPSDAP